MFVSKRGAGVVKLNGTAAYRYPASAPIQDGKAVLEAVPAAGYRFDGWTGDIDGKDNPLTLEMDCPKMVTANFSPLNTKLPTEEKKSGSNEPVKDLRKP